MISGWMISIQIPMPFFNRYHREFKEELTAGLFPHHAMPAPCGYPSISSEKNIDSIGKTLTGPAETSPEISRSRYLLPICDRSVVLNSRPGPDGTVRSAAGCSGKEEPAEEIY